jgi:hypothetical protein
MARSRNIKPGFYKNEDLAECSVLARLLFPGLWLLADREGRLEDRPKRIKGEIFPFDNVDTNELLNELKQWGFIKRYQVGEKNYIQVLNFCSHQSPHCTEKDSVIPDYDGFFIVHERLKNGCATGKFAKVAHVANVEKQSAQTAPHMKTVENQTDNSCLTDSMVDGQATLTLFNVNGTLENSSTTVNNTNEHVNPPNHNALIPDSLIPDSLNPDLTTCAESYRFPPQGSRTQPHLDPEPPTPTPTPSAKKRGSVAKPTIEFTGEAFTGIEAFAPSWAAAFPAVDVPTELAKATVWLIANPANKKSNYARFLANWLTKAQERAPARGVMGMPTHAVKNAWTGAL